MKNREAQIRARLTEAFAPLQLDIADDSEKHNGHAGNPDGAGGTHYRVTMVSAAFTGQSRVQRSRAVHDALAPEFDTGLHALSLTLRAPEEAV